MRRAVRRVVAVEGGRGCGGAGRVMSCGWGGWLVGGGGVGGGWRGFTGIGSEVVGFFATTTSSSSSSSSSFSEGASTTTTAAAVVADGGMVWFWRGSVCFGMVEADVWYCRSDHRVESLIIVKQLGKGLWGEGR